MNKARRAEIKDVLSTLNDVLDSVNSILDDEQEYMDNIPENLQSGEMYEIAEDAVDNLTNAQTSLEEAIESLEAAGE